jgi:pimeloyl-ACP methyl ester carboxylesterase
MGELSDELRLPRAAVEYPLPWGPVMRGVRTGDGADIALLLHEPGADLDAWGAFPSRLARALPVTVVALDLPGHGLTDDPWEPERLGEVVRVAMSDGLPRESAYPSGFRFLIAAGATATSGLQLAAELALTGVVCLSPVAMEADSKPERSPRVAKLIVAGAQAGSDLQTARRFAGQCGGWAVVTSLPVAAHGTALLAWDRAAQLEEAIVAFLRDSARRRVLTRMPLPPG